MDPILIYGTLAAIAVGVLVALVVFQRLQSRVPNLVDHLRDTLERARGAAREAGEFLESFGDRPASGDPHDAEPTDLQQGQVTWQDRHGRWHINGTGVVLDQPTSPAVDITDQGLTAQRLRERELRKYRAPTNPPEEQS